jgi:indolepyruvate ferredoxin oxidoreductase
VAKRKRIIAMNAPVQPLSVYQLADRYSQTQGRVFMSGTQALVRVMLDQARRDRQAGLNTAGFVSGYRGSPLGGVDLELWRERSRIAEAGIEFLPAVNEDLAATAILGSQQVEINPDKTVDGVFGLWYGKGPGLDRAGDALRHGNAYGASPHGGVLVVAGDDHGCVSSSMPHQSDVAFMTWFMPTLNPASVAEYLQFGEYGYALSRYSGMWVGFKAISETVESAASFDLPVGRVFKQPDYQAPEDGLHYRWPDLPGPQIEERLVHKKEAVLEFASANPIDRAIHNLPSATFGIVTTGKAHLDLMEALRLLGLDESACRELGLDIYKVGMVWPLARREALAFVRGKKEVMVIEEKRGIIESQFKEYFYDWPGDKPDLMVGKRDENGNRLVPWTGELSPKLLVPLVARRLHRHFPEAQLLARADKALGTKPISISIDGATRTPYFCSGCPHNTSTVVPEGSKALAGIGCHFMASWMNRETTSLIQMGGEGVNWAASSRFTGRKHIFQNLGEGTWYHSGSMAIRQSLAAGANITYKILYNDAVAMTGGQPVDGPVSVIAIAHSVRAEGVQRIALVSDEPTRFNASDFPSATTIHHRDALDQVQRELREISGVTVLIYEQTCATEKRRRRKRGTMPVINRTVVINDRVCEGCGDCSAASNCLSVEPIETEFGSKRRINQSSCNKDFSCVNGFCPSFVSVSGTPKAPAVSAVALDDLVPGDPVLPSLDTPWNLLITGVGGTGVVTVAALVTMAAHLEGKGTSVLDFTGFAQKFGPVLSYVRIGQSPESVNQVRIDTASADALLGCDIVVSSSPKASASYQPGMKLVLNTAAMPTGDIVQRRDANLQIDSRVRSIAVKARVDNPDCINANELAEKVFGDTVFSNMIMLGYAWQLGLVPVGESALLQAVELNGVALEKNRKAVAVGRIAACFPDELALRLKGTDAKITAGKIAAIDLDKLSIDDVIDRNCNHLTDYQSSRYAGKYRNTLTEFSHRLSALTDADRDTLVKQAARYLYKLMAYKDEYEVARLHTNGQFKSVLDAQFEEGYSVTYHLAPPLLPGKKDWRGRPRKREFGTWLNRPMAVLAAGRRVRGTPLDVFGYTSERKLERSLIKWYRELLQQCAQSVSAENLSAWSGVLSAPDGIRGYGVVKEESITTVKQQVKDHIEKMQHH